MRTTVNSEATVFVGREAFLQELHELLQSQRRVVISAPAGVGKTAVAAEYARRFSRAYEQIFHVNMTSLAGWLVDCLELAEHLALAISAEEAYPAGFNQALQDWLVQHPHALLIIDDVGRVAFSPEALPPAAHVLFLTRQPIDDSSIAHLALPALDAEDGALLLLRQSGRWSSDITLEQVDAETSAAALTLADELAGLPLALHLASANMRVSGRSVQEFLDLYRQYAARLGQFKLSKDRATDALAITCSLPARRLHRTHQVAAELLWLCSVLAPLPIPRALFLQGAGELTPALQALAHNPALLDEALDQLSALGLLVSDEKGQSLRLQLTVQETLCQAQAEEARNSLIVHALRAFARVLPILEQATPAARLRSAVQILHLARLSSDWIIPYEAVAQIFERAASLFWEYGLIQDAELLLRKTLLIQERVLGTGHEMVGVTMRNLGLLSAQLKNYAEAEKLLQSAMLARSRALGATHPDVLLCLLDLANIYAEQDKDMEVRACYQEVLKIGEPALDQAHPLLITAAHKLAVLSSGEGNFAEAEDYYRRALSAYEASLGMADSQTQECLEQLADVLLEQEKYGEAEELLRSLLRACEDTSGMEDPRAQRCLELVALLCSQQERYGEAEALLQRLLTVKERVLGIEHPETRLLLQKIAEHAIAQGEPARAEQIYLRLCAFCETAPDHARTEARQYLEHLTFLYLQQGKAAEAESAMQRLSQLPV
jgi:hypothetical protein